MALKLKAPVGSWWLDYGPDEGVWPCDVVRWTPFGVVVVPTHEAAPGYGTKMTVPMGRVYDSDFNRPKWEEAD
jgi:hypothetical protein